MKARNPIIMDGGNRRLAKDFDGVGADGMFMGGMLGLIAMPGMSFATAAITSAAKQAANAIDLVQQAIFSNSLNDECRSMIDAYINNQVR
ncbi:hypothetical protein Dsin_010267 [Dipteronia sinensis]|uniref:Uncharacterized protein n=1 Tax=Dipteronia sinensis TaxID=43782 RepID=A0AAE0ATB8_9ROSI|nr:hypothetical protein Dsin_010267 [Dipteronia sinensis]